MPTATRLRVSLQELARSHREKVGACFLARALTNPYRSTVLVASFSSKGREAAERFSRQVNGPTPGNTLAAGLRKFEVAVKSLYSVATFTDAFVPIGILSAR